MLNQHDINEEGGRSIPLMMRIAASARGDLPTIGKNDVGRQQIVDGEPDAAGQVAYAAAQRNELTRSIAPQPHPWSSCRW
jgi:hypothetical protein